MIYKKKEYTEEELRRMFNPRTGTHHTEESKRKISESMKGKQNRKGKTKKKEISEE